MNVKQVAHLCIKSPDLDAVKFFYSDLLGGLPQFNFTRNGKIVGFYLKLGSNTFIEIFQSSEVSHNRQSNVLDHVCFEVDALEPLRNKLLSAGFEPGEIKTGSDRTRQFWVKGPDGHNIEFQEYGPESSQFTGKDVEVNW